ADRRRPWSRHRDGRLVGVAVHAADDLRRGRAGGDRLSPDGRQPRPSRPRPVFVPVRGRQARVQVSGPLLLAGPDPSAGPERLAAHTRRLGPLPKGGPALIDLLVRTELTGRGGAGFPAGLKWRAVAAASRGSAVVV